MRIVITGITGQLGSAAVKTCLDKGHAVLGLSRRPIETYGTLRPAFAEICTRSIDLTDPKACLREFAAFQPDALIHCAGWTAVDAAELPENREAVFRSNTLIPAVLAQVCRETGAKMIYPGTDYVFDGSGSRPWDPDTDTPHPLNVYGMSKLAGEREVQERLPQSFLVRTSWIFENGYGNFVQKILQAGNRQSEIRVVADQIGRPAYAPDLAELFCELIETERYGCYHATNEGNDVSRCDFAKEIIRRSGLAAEVIPVSSDAYASPARRPLNSRLSTEKLKKAGFRPLPTWTDALSRYFLLEESTILP